MNYEPQHRMNQTYSAETCPMVAETRFAEYLAMLAMLLMLASLVASAFLTAIGQ